MCHTSHDVITFKRLFTPQDCIQVQRAALLVYFPKYCLVMEKGCLSGEVNYESFHMVNFDVLH